VADFHEDILSGAEEHLIGDGVTIDIFIHA
jgi:hypothetical protein